MKRKTNRTITIIKLVWVRLVVATRHIIISFNAENRRVANLLYQNRFTIDTNNNFGKVKLYKHGKGKSVLVHIVNVPGLFIFSVLVLPGTLTLAFQNPTWFWKVALAPIRAKAAATAVAATSEKPIELCNNKRT